MAIQTTSDQAQAWRPDISEFHPGQAVPEALIMTTSSIMGEIEGDAPAVRVAWVDDAEADFVGEGEQIPVENPTLDETLVYTGKISQLVHLSREAYYREQVAENISTSVARAVIKRADSAYLAQAAPTAPDVTPPTGLLNVSGITDGGTLGTNLDVIVDAVASIEGAGGNASHIITDPATWGQIAKIKAGTGSEVPLIGAPGTEAPIRSLNGVPVITNAAIPQGTLLVLDKDAIASAVGHVMVASSEHAYFNSDSIALRCTWRIGWSVMHTDRLVKIATDTE